MPTYPYDPKTGKKLMRAGREVNPISPMTQEEVDLQCDLVSACLKVGVDEVTEADEELFDVTQFVRDLKDV